MPLLDILKRGWEIFGHGDIPTELWATDEGEFENHFGRSYEEFVERLSGLDRSHTEMYEKTMQVNPEAAVAWVFFL